MSSSKRFTVNVKPRDVLIDFKGLSDRAAKAYHFFWMLHELHGEPLPPREERIDRAEWDFWFRDHLDMKNVRTWIAARDELLRLAKIRQADDGRLYIGRTMRAIEEKRGGDASKWGGDSDQGRLELGGVHPAQRHRMPTGLPQPAVEKPVGEAPGEQRQSGEVRPKIERTSPDVRSIRLPKFLILRGSRPALSYSKSKSLHEVVVAVPFAAPRARGDPTIAA